MTRSLFAGAALLLVAACSDAGADKAAPAAAATPGRYAADFEKRWPIMGVPVTQDEVKAMVASQGAAPAVQALAANPDGPTRWLHVTRSMASGDAAWLALAPLVAPGTENETAYDLQGALQDALVRNPAALLPLAPQLPSLGGDVTAFCIDSGIETPPAEAQAFYADAIAAVEAVNDPALESLKAACLSSLRAGAATPPPS